MVDPSIDLGPYYAGSYYQFDAHGEPAWKNERARIAAASFRVELLRRYVSPGHLIEVGAGTGAFACLAQGAGFQVSAIEMSEECCRFLNRQEGIAAICTDRPLEALPSLAPAVAVAMWHVLEHLSKPAEMLQRAAAALQPGGVLAIGVPNSRSLQFRLLGRRWPHLDAPRHLCLVAPAALVARGEELGLRCVAMTTNDPDGLDCNLFGWTGAVRRRPAQGPTWFSGQAGHALEVALGPLERRGHRGAAITLVMRKES
jgi:SAM-dependent methyltransferase